MALPYSYQNIIEIPGSEKAEILQSIQRIAHSLKSKGYKKLVINKENLNFRSDSALFGIAYDIRFHFKKKDSLNIIYEIKLMPLIKITLILIVFIAFFSGFGMSLFLWVSIIVASAFFLFNLIIIDSHIQKLIRQSNLYKSFNPENSENFSVEQKTWMEDQNKCPACGMEINEYDIYCPDCGLRLKQNSISIPLNVSKYKNKRFSYHYKKKPRKND